VALAGGVLPSHDDRQLNISCVQYYIPQLVAAQKTTMSTAAGFSKRTLSGACHSSMPLVVPDDMAYDSSTNELQQIPGKKRGGLVLVPETLSMLRTIVGPLAVLAIGGPCRSGKSYVLSRLLDSADAFALGHTMDAKTFGIWIGTTVLESDKFTVLLMDTEGIDAANAKARDDASILVMTVLLSSYFIYNSIGVPRKNDLEKMRYEVLMGHYAV